MISAMQGGAETVFPECEFFFWTLAGVPCGRGTGACRTGRPASGHPCCAWPTPWLPGSSLPAKHRGIGTPGPPMRPGRHQHYWSPENGGGTEVNHCCKNIHVPCTNSLSGFIQGERDLISIAFWSEDV